MQNNTERACVLCNTIKNAYVFYINNRMAPKVFSVASKIQHFQDGRCTSARDCCSCKEAISCCMERWKRCHRSRTHSLFHWPESGIICLCHSLLARPLHGCSKKIWTHNGKEHAQVEQFAHACRVQLVPPRAPKLHLLHALMEKKVLLPLIQPTFLNFLIKSTNFKLKRQFQQTKNLANL